MDRNVQHYLQAFWRLCHNRQGGMGPLPLLFADLVLYFDRLAWFCHDLEFWLDMLQALDQTYLKSQVKDDG